MSTISCPVCSEKIDAYAMVCPQCRKIITEEDRAKARSSKRYGGFVGLCAFGLFIGLGVYFMSDIVIFVDRMQRSETPVSDFTAELFDEDTPTLQVSPEPYTILVDKVRRNYLTGKGQNVQKARPTRQLIIALVPDENGFTKEGLSGDDLAATVMEAAQTHYTDDYPIVDVRIMTENAKSMHATVTLARAVYIPDEKDYSGRKRNKVWVVLQVADRGISHEEQRYLTAWGEMLPESQSFLESFNIYDTKVRTEHDIAVSKRLNIEPQSIDPFANQMRDYPTN